MYKLHRVYLIIICGLLLTLGFHKPAQCSEPVPSARLMFVGNFDKHPHIEYAVEEEFRKSTRLNLFDLKYKTDLMIIVTLVEVRYSTATDLAYVFVNTVVSNKGYSTNYHIKVGNNWLEYPVKLIGEVVNSEHFK